MVLKSARGAQKVREESKKLQMFSKQWLPGDNLRVFLPVFYDADTGWELAVGALWGHKVNDFEGIGLKSTFIPSLTDFDDNGLPIGPPDITYKFSQIAKCFVDGQKAAETAAIQQKAWPSESSRAEALKKVEFKYDTKNNMKAVRAAISRPMYYITTECLCVKVINDIPKADSIVVASLPLSSTKINELYTILADPKYQPKQGEEFIEIEWRFPTDTAKEKSAQAAHPSGLTEEFRLKTTSPDTWRQIESMLSMVMHDSNSIVKRATSKIEESKIHTALASYCIINSDSLNTIDEEDVELLCKHADVVKQMSFIKNITNQEIVDKITAACNEVIKAAPAPEQIPDLSGVNLETPEPVPDITSLMNSADMAPMSDIELDSIDLSMM